MKNKVTNLDIVVRVIGGKPYYSLKYKELGNNYFNVGYSSYLLENVIAWKNEYFDMVQWNEDDGWIPVDEKLPDVSGTYQVTCMDGRIYRSTYAKFQCKLKRWELTGARSYWKVIAWMPLPKPYRIRRIRA